MAGKAVIILKGAVKELVPMSGIISKRCHSSFSQLERSIHEIDFEYNFLDGRCWRFENSRTQLPLGSGHAFATPAADGQMGRLINMYS